MSYELFRAGVLVSGPNGARWASDTDVAAVVIALMRAGTNYDEDDYTATPVYLIGYVGSVDAMPLRWPEHFDLFPRDVSLTDARRWKWFRDEATAEQYDAIHRCLTSVEMDEIADACIRERDPRFTITDAGRAALTDESK